MMIPTHMRILGMMTQAAPEQPLHRLQPPGVDVLRG